MDRSKLLEIRVKRDAGELRHLSGALHYLVEFLGAELASLSAAEYAIVVVV
jgi:hypothetical protein